MPRQRRAVSRAITSACDFLLLEQRRMMSVGLDGRLWYIDGDVARRTPDDVIVVEADPARPTRLRASINGVIVGKVDAKAIDTIYIDAGRGDDRVLLKLPSRYDDIRTRVDGGGGADTLLGGSGRDELRGGRGDDLLDGGGGADLIHGDDDNDDIAGGDGSDQLLGDDGADTMSGGWGQDQLAGGDGNDQLRGGADGDNLAGNEGNDTLRGSDGRDKLTGGPDADRLLVESGKDRANGRAWEIRSAPDDEGAVHRMADRDAWADRIIQTALQNHQQTFGREIGRYYAGDGGYAVTFLSSASGGRAMRTAFTEVVGNISANSALDAAYSVTNTQVAGVDEADIVETDGRYIYSLSNQTLHITDVRDASRLSVASSTQLGVTDPLGMYLRGTTLTILSNHYETEQVAGDGSVIAVNGIYGRYGGKQVTRVTTFDVSDPTSPSQISETKVDGWHQASRMIDGRLYLVVNNSVGLYPQSVQEGDVWRYETEAEFTARVRDDFANAAPQYTLTTGGQTFTGDVVDGSNIYMPAAEDASSSSQLTTVLMIDTTNPSAGPVASASYAGGEGVCYVSGESLYLVRGGWGEEGGKVVKFGLAGTNLTVEATGAFDGSILNQFALDEKDGFLRVASTVRTGFGATSNTVSVLDQIGDEMQIVGQVNGIAPGEQIFASRFIGDELFLTTATVITDPLWTIDLSDPSEPTVLGELKIPGVSTYLHPLDDNHLIGFGRNGTFDRMGDGLQLSLYDITDRTNPKLEHTYEFGTADDAEWSSASWDHLSFQFDAETGVLMVPIFTYGASRLEMVRVDADSGFDQIGQIDGLSNDIYRGAWVGQNVFAIGNQSIKSADKATGELRGTMELDQA